LEKKRLRKDYLVVIQKKIKIKFKYSNRNNVNNINTILACSNKAIFDVKILQN
jgi:hypothetical protein